jgi:hypothetical protein
MIGLAGQATMPVNRRRSQRKQQEAFAFVVQFISLL